MSIYTVKKRTFEALNYPKDSAQRKKLNESAVTSEYMPSYKYVLVTNLGQDTPFTYRTKKEALSKNFRL